jgi:aminopeptidase-like protein
VLEHNRYYMNLNPKCEPQLGKRGLYAAIGGDSDVAKKQLAMLWVLNMSDGRHSLLDIAEQAQAPFRLIRSTAQVLEQHGLLQVTTPPR